MLYVVAPRLQACCDIPTAAAAAAATPHTHTNAFTTPHTHHANNNNNTNKSKSNSKNYEKQVQRKWKEPTRHITIMDTGEEVDDVDIDEPPTTQHRAQQRYLALLREKDKLTEA